MNNTDPSASPAFGHSHIFLGTGHERNERKTWAVISLCSLMMAIEIIGGHLFGSLALVADGLHMSTHAAALLIAALAYTYSRRHANDARFVFGTGKLGDLAGFTSAIILAMIALLIGYEAIERMLDPVPIHFNEAIPIAIVGLIVNLASAWLLSDTHHPGHDYHGHPHHGHEDIRYIPAASGTVALEIFEDRVVPRFRLRLNGMELQHHKATIETLRPDGERQVFTFMDQGAYLESREPIPEPHEFEAILQLDAEEYRLVFTEHGPQIPDADQTAGQPAHTHRDNNIYAAYIHVLADASVSVLVIIGLVLARTFAWNWMDPLVGIIGALVIANWAFGLLRHTGGILLDMNLDQHMLEKVRRTIETDGDQLMDLHLWRLGPGHMGAIVSVITKKAHDATYYHNRLSQFSWLSHVTIEVQQNN